MTEWNCGAMAPLKRPLIGPLGPYLDGFASRLGGEGYAPGSVQGKWKLVVGLSRWLNRYGISLEALDEDVLGRFVRGRQGHVRRGGAATGRRLLGYLRDIGCIPHVKLATKPSPLDDLIEDFKRYLKSERGLSQASLDNYLPTVRRFLAERFGSGPIQFNGLRPLDVHGFVVRLAKAGSRNRARLTVTALRSFLRFLQQRGAIATDIAGGVPGIANWSLSLLPKSLPPGQIEEMLAACDRRTPAGQRDHAILLLLARLGLRAGELVALNLEDLDWERGEIVVRGKGQRLARLPLPADVGTALVGYLRDVRPACSTRRVFIRMRAPLHGLVGSSAIDCIVRRALRRAGLNPEFKGAHLLRHSLATDLLRRGASLTEIGQLLRHSQPTTTQIYAKVDIAALRTIGLVWPGAAS